MAPSILIGTAGILNINFEVDKYGHAFWGGKSYLGIMGSLLPFSMTANA